MDEQIGIVWRRIEASGHTILEAVLEPHGVVARIVPEDKSLPLDAECNALAYLRKRGDDKLSLFLAKVDAQAAAHMIHAALVKAYAS